MRIPKPGKITEHFYSIGIPDTPVYLLDGPKPVLFDAGYAGLGRLYEQGIREILGNRAPAYLFMTHSHFDHLGAAAHFKDRWPNLKIGASAKTREILSKPNAVALITTLNRQATEELDRNGITPLDRNDFRTFDFDLTLRPDEVMTPSPGLTIRVIHSPGHTWDFLSFWIEESRILVASEAAGIDDGFGYIYSEFLVDYDAYYHSLERLNRLEPEVVCPGHQMVLTGEDARRHLRSALIQAEKYLNTVEEWLRREAGDIDRVVARIKSEEWDPKPAPKQPESAYLLNTRIRVRKIWERMEKQAVGRLTSAGG